MEQEFLDSFDAGRIRSLLDRVMPDSGKNFMDNICEMVLLCAVGCIISDKPVHSLELDAVDCAEIRAYFLQLSREFAVRVCQQGFAF